MAAPIDLAYDFANFRAFVNNLFDDDEQGGGSKVRSADPDVILNMDPQRKPAVHWFNPLSCERVLVELGRAWLEPDTCLYAKSSDKRLMAMMKESLGGRSMFVPRLELDGSFVNEVRTGGVPVVWAYTERFNCPKYKVRGYGRYDLSKDDAVYEFLRLFLAGAHFVVIDNRTDAGGAAGSSFYLDFEDEANLSTWRGTATGHSHYTSAVALGTAYAYPKTITTEKAPVDCPIVTALIVDSTSSKEYSDYNTFFQFEGWPGVTNGGAGGRHAADFLLHQKTKWNISTYGMCPYSEKRGTAVFITRHAWSAAVTGGMKMPKFKGAETEQGWLTKASITSNDGGVTDVVT